jgi:chromate transporter
MAQPLPWKEALEAWALIAGQSYGGPAGQIAVMHKIVVEERRWLGEERFLHALNYCMLLPGPEAQQLITYIGWLSHGLRGGLVAGSLFVLPGFVTILILSLLYSRFHHLATVEAALFGLKAAVLAIVVDAMIRIGRRVATTPATMTLALLAFLALYVGHVPFPAVILAAGLVGALLSRFFSPPPPPSAKSAGETPFLLDKALEEDQLPHVHPDTPRDLLTGACILVAWLLPVAVCWAWLGPDATFTQIGRFFAGAATVTFGGAYSVLAYVGQQAVESYGWLTPGEMLDGLGFAETTPGPLIQVVQFVGFLAAYRDPGALNPTVSAVLGSVLTTWVTFAPSFLWVLTGAPYIERIRQVPVLSSALRAITASVVGVIANLSLWFLMHVWFGVANDLSTVRPLAVVISLLALVALVRFKVPMTPVLIVGALAGLLGWWVGLGA